MVSRAAELSNEAIELEHSHQYARAAELYSEAVTLLEQASPSQLVSVFVTMYKQKRDYLVAKSKQPPTVPLPLDFSDEFLIVDEQNDFLDCGLKFDERANPEIGV
jgi:hypothetical protein